MHLDLHKVQFARQMGFSAPCDRVEIFISWGGFLFFFSLFSDDEGRIRVINLF